eukprot:3994089-Pyramimonas_sp.AAC.1
MSRDHRRSESRATPGIKLSTNQDTCTTTCVLLFTYARLPPKATPSHPTKFVLLILLLGGEGELALLDENNLGCRILHIMHSCPPTVAIIRLNLEIFGRFGARLLSPRGPVRASTAGPI